MKIWWALFRNELNLYLVERGLAFSFVLSLALLAIFRFGMPAEGDTGILGRLEAFPVVAYCIAVLQLLLMAIHWESEAYAYRFYAMHRVSLSALFLAKTAVTFLIQIPLWIFCLTGYLLFFPVEVPTNSAYVSLYATCILLGLAMAPAGQLVAAIANHSTQKNFLAISLFLPFCLPALIAATGRLTAILSGVETLRYDALLLATALVSLGAGNLLFAYLFEE
jgi:ABC-type transport system involved in cytochrome c biogenesis permease component